MARCPYQIPNWPSEDKINGLGLVKSDETYSNLCQALRTLNCCIGDVGPSNVHRWEGGKRDGRDDTEN